jgi:hypothetical protein
MEAGGDEILEEGCCILCTNPSMVYLLLSLMPPLAVHCLRAEPEHIVYGTVGEPTDRTARHLDELAAMPRRRRLLTSQ